MAIVIEQRTISRLKSNDKISLATNSITINGVCFNFAEGEGLTFIPPHAQIYTPCRDNDGNLVATVIQYVTEIGSAEECEQDVVKTIEAIVDEEFAEEEELVDNELAEVDTEMQAIREEVERSILDKLVDEELGVTNE